MVRGRRLWEGLAGVDGASFPADGGVRGVVSPGSGFCPAGWVGSAYTSRTCAECGHIDKANRVSQARFACRNRGVVAHADRNGSRDIRARARELWRRGAPSTAPDPCPEPGQGTGRERGTTASGARYASPGLLIPGR
ncbi:hypothetical protein GCM10022245_58550 [Streptomyces mayteni]